MSLKGGRGSRCWVVDWGALAPGLVWIADLVTAGCSVDMTRVIGARHACEHRNMFII